jgi:ATP synthase I chain
MSIQRLYALTFAFGLIGFVSYWLGQGFTPGLAFLLGSFVSLGNLWLFHWLARAIEPGERSQKPWQAGAFIGRYLILFTLGYVIVKGLNVNPLPVVFGLFASTAAVIFSSVADLVQNLFRPRRTH